MSKEKNEQRSTITFQPLESVAQLMPYALMATGKNQSALINECIKKHLESIIDEIKASQDVNYKLFKDANSKNQPHKTPSAQSDSAFVLKTKTPKSPQNEKSVGNRTTPTILPE